MIETGYKCSGGSPTSKDTCTEICGDGITLGILPCDDGKRFILTDKVTPLVEMVAAQPAK